LEAFIAKGGALRAETTGNLLLVRGPSRERQSLMEVAMSFDVDWLKGQSAGIYPLTHTTPDEMIAELTQAMQADQSDLMSKMVRFQPIHRMNAVLVLSRQSGYLQQAATWIRRLDRSTAAGQSLYVYRVEYGKAQDLAALLGDTLGISSGSASRTRRSEVAPGREVSSLSAKPTQPTQPTGPLAATTASNNTQAGPAAQARPAVAVQPERPAPRPPVSGGAHS